MKGRLANSPQGQSFASNSVSPFSSIDDKSEGTTADGLTFADRKAAAVAAAAAAAAAASTDSKKEIEDEPQSEDFEDGDPETRSESGDPNASCTRRNRWSLLFGAILVALLLTSVAIMATSPASGNGNDDGVVGAGFGFGGGGSKNNDDFDDPLFSLPGPTGSESSVGGADGGGASTTGPSIAPTASDMVSVVAAFTISAASPPTETDKASLKTALASSAGVIEDSIKDLSVTTTGARRLQYKSETPPVLRPRRLAVTWEVSCTITSPLSEVAGAPSSSGDFATSLQTSLSSSVFTNSVTAAIPSATVNTETIALVAATRRPTAQPTKTPTAITKPPAAGQRLTVGPGRVTFARAPISRLFRLFATATTGAEHAVLAGRSYDGHDWEAAPPLNLLFACTAEACAADIPSSTDRAYHVEEASIEAPIASSNQTLAARLLNQATFGTTKASLGELVASHDGDAERWVKKQMQLPLSSHREFIRRRSNTRPLVKATGTMAVRPVCAQYSRWTRVTFHYPEDTGSVITVVPTGRNDGTVTLFVDGFARTEAPAADFAIDPSYGELKICNIDNWVGGQLRVGGNCQFPTSLQKEIPGGNPIVSFQDPVAIALAKRLAFNASSPTFAASLIDIAGTTVPDTKLLSQTVTGDSCSVVISVGPIFAQGAVKGEVVQASAVPTQCILKGKRSHYSKTHISASDRSLPGVRLGRAGRACRKHVGGTAGYFHWRPHLRHRPEELPKSRQLHHEHQDMQIRTGEYLLCLHIL
jgi:hypothetical protein